MITDVHFWFGIFSKVINITIRALILIFVFFPSFTKAQTKTIKKYKNITTGLKYDSAYVLFPFEYQKTLVNKSNNYVVDTLMGIDTLYILREFKGESIEVSKDTFNYYKKVIKKR